MLAFYVVGLLLTTAFFMWFIFDYYGGFNPLYVAVKKNSKDNLSPIFVFSVMLGMSLVLSIIGWPLVLVALIINLNKRYKETGKFKILVPKTPKVKV
jgi:uncharacterized membrane protein YozB (DUF420 family)